MMDILKSFLMIFPEWLAAILVAVGAVAAALGLVRLGYGLFVAKTVYKWIVNAEEKFGSGMGAEKESPRYCSAARLHPRLAGLGNQ